MTNRVNAVVGAALASARTHLRNGIGREGGQTFVEYTLVILLVAVAVATGALVDPFRDAIGNALTAISDALDDAWGG
jgi:Flp pilus assembly pilin Flp